MTKKESLQLAREAKECIAGFNSPCNEVGFNLFQFGLDEDELNVFVGNIRKFTALPGSSSDTYAVKISSIVREE